MSDTRIIGIATGGIIIAIATTASLWECRGEP
jgi:orotate phosphoribosyltransferase